MKVLTAVCAFAAALVAAVQPPTPCLPQKTKYAPPALAHYATASESAPQTEQDTAVYARALSREAYFCTSQDAATGIFAVPYTYCVEVLGDDGEWYRAKYADDHGIYRALYGYVRKTDFEILDEKPQTVYLYKPVTVTFSQDAPSVNLPVIDDITLTAAFYGSYYSGAAGYSYVLCEDSFGYIVGANEDYPLILPETKPAQTTPGATKSQGGKIAAGIVLGTLALLAVIVVALSGRHSRRKKRDEDPFGGRYR